MKTHNNTTRQAEGDPLRIADFVEREVARVIKGGTWRGAGMQAVRVLLTHFATAYPQRGASRPQFHPGAAVPQHDPKSPEGVLWRALATAAASLPSQLRKAGGSFFAPAGEGLGAAADELVAIVSVVAQARRERASPLIVPLAFTLLCK